MYDYKRKIEKGFQYLGIRVIRYRLAILLMTVEPDEDEKTDFTGIFGAGTNDFITKPITEDNLIERLVNLVNVKRQNEALTNS